MERSEFVACTRPCGLLLEIRPVFTNELGISFILCCSPVRWSSSRSCGLEGLSPIVSCKLTSASSIVGSRVSLCAHCNGRREAVLLVKSATCFQTSFQVPLTSARGRPRIIGAALSRFCFSPEPISCFQNESLSNRFQWRRDRFVSGCPNSRGSRVRSARQERRTAAQGDWEEKPGSGAGGSEPQGKGDTQRTSRGKGKSPPRSFPPSSCSPSIGEERTRGERGDSAS